MSLPDAQRAAFLAWASDRWRADAYRHISETSGEWDAWQAALAAQASEVEALRKRAETWELLYMRAINAANGLTNYVEDRPELSKIERELVAVEAAAARYESPSAVYRPSLSVDGNQWCALYGDNLQDGVAGFGDSPADAMWNFDQAWTTKLTRGISPAGADTATTGER